MLDGEGCPPKLFSEGGPNFSPAGYGWQATLTINQKGSIS